MIGRELATSQGLLEWFLAQAAARCAASAGGVQRPDDTGALPRVIADVVERHPALDGLWHVGAEPIAKHDLLVHAARRVRARRRDRARRRGRDRPQPRLAAASARRPAARPPSWPEMVAELAAADGYARLRQDLADR